MTTIDKIECPECGKEATRTDEGGITTNVHCTHCGYAFNCEIENQGDDQAAWDAYPDGWTCIVCGESYAGIMPADTKEGTICKDCV